MLFCLKEGLEEQFQSCKFYQHSLAKATAHIADIVWAEMAGESDRFRHTAAVGVHTCEKAYGGMNTQSHWILIQSSLPMGGELNVYFFELY